MTVTASFGRDKAIIALAREQHARNDETEIDGNAVVSEGDDNGAFVQAWVWVDFTGTPLDKDLEDDPEVEEEDT